MLDPVTHEKKKRKFLDAHYDLAAAHPGEPDMTLARIEAADVGARAGCTSEEGLRFCTELEAEGMLVRVMRGPKCTITVKGMLAVEAARDSGSWPGWLRKHRGWLAEVAGKAIAKAAETLWVGFLGLLGGWLLGVATADKAWSFWGWIKSGWS